MNFNIKISLIAVLSLFILAGTFIFFANQSQAYDQSCILGSYNPSEYCESPCIDANKIGCSFGACSGPFANGTLRQDGAYCCMAVPSGGEVCASPYELSYGCYEYNTHIPVSQCYQQQCSQRGTCNETTCPSPQFRCESGTCIQPLPGGSSCGQANICGGTNTAGNGICQQAVIYISFSPPNIEVGESTTYTINGYVNALVNIRQTVNGIFFGSGQVRLNDNGVYTGSYTFQPGQAGTFITTVSYADYSRVSNESRLIVREHPLASSLEIITPQNFYTLPFNLTLKIRGTPNSPVLVNAISTSNNHSFVILNDHTERGWLTGVASADGYGEWTHTFTFSDNAFIGNWTIWVNVGGQISNQVNIQVIRPLNIGQSGQAQVSLGISPSVIAVGEGVNVSINVSPSSQTFNQLRVWLSSNITGILTSSDGARIIFSDPISSFVTLLNLAAAGATSVNIGPGNWSITTAGVFYESAIFEVYVEAWNGDIPVGRSNSAFFEVQPLGGINLGVSYDSARQTTQYLLTSNYNNRTVYLWRWKNNQPEVQEEILGTTDNSGRLSATVDQTCGENTYLAYVVISGVGNSNSVIYDTPCSEGFQPPPDESPNLWVTLLANPSSGNNPLFTNLVADVFGNSQGTVNYTFWWNCNNPTESVASAVSACGDPDGVLGNQSGAKHDNINAVSKVVSHTYNSVGTYYPKVIVERGGFSAEARAPVYVRAQVPGAPYGWLDEASCEPSRGIYGWAVDDDCTLDPSNCESIHVHLYDDEILPNLSNFLIDINANLDSPDVIAVGASTPDPNDYGNARNRFYLPTSIFPQALKDGRAHQIFAYPIDYPSGFGNANVILTDSPKELTCPRAEPTLVIDPSIASVSIGGTSQFRALYDADGPSWPQPEQNVTDSADWSSADISLASPTAFKGQFRGNSVGTAVIEAVYQGLRALSSLGVVSGPVARYKCQDNSCVRDDVNGVYINSNCDNACGGGGAARYKCQGSSCVRDDMNGTYTSSNCNNACEGGDGGNGNGNGNGNGTNIFRDFLFKIREIIPH